MCVSVDSKKVEIVSYDEDIDKTLGIDSETGCLYQLCKKKESRGWCLDFLDSPGKDLYPGDKEILSRHFGPDCGSGSDDVG